MKLPYTGPYTAKDQLKSNKANKFIGRGSARSSTNKYRIAWGELANCGEYDNTDVVFISAEGDRLGRKPPDLNEILKATLAGAIMIIDVDKDRNRPYNVGEREVHQFLMSCGAREISDGIFQLDGVK